MKRSMAKRGNSGGSWRYLKCDESPEMRSRAVRGERRSRSCVKCVA